MLSQYAHKKGSRHNISDRHFLAQERRKLVTMIFFTLPILFFWINTIDFIVLAKVYNFKPTDHQGVPGEIISGSYIVQLADEANATNVRATAVEMATKMQSVKKLLIANGTLSRSNIVTDAEVSPSLIFTETIKGFLMNGVSQEIYSMLLKIKNVIRVEPDRVVSITGVLGKKNRNLLPKHKDQSSVANPEHNRLLQSKSQVLPWGIKRIGGPIKPNPNPNGKVFIIDTGIAPLSDLNINKALSINFADWYFDPPNPLWYDGDGHGTHVAGTVAAIDNDINVVGVVPGASVVAVRVLDESGFGTLSTVIAGIEYVASKGKVGDVANLSLGGEFSQILNNAVEKAAAKGIKFAIAAGNDYDDAQYYSPASATGENIYTVSCFDENDSFCSFSNYGSVVDYSGPGKDVESLSPDGGTAIGSGTSMSTPHIAGLLLAGSIQVGGYVKCDPDGLPDPIAVKSSGPISPTPAPTPVPADRFAVTIMTDGYATTETAWTLYKLLPNSRSLIASKSIGAYNNYMLYSEKYTLASGLYEFNITDASGDGIFLPGYYSIMLGGTALKEKGGYFKYFDTFTFTVGQNSPTATPIPTLPNQLDFTILTDIFGYEIGWSLFQVAQSVPKLIASKAPGTYKSEQLFTEQYYLDIGKYELNVTDNFGDGIICPGYFSISLGGVLLKKRQGKYKIDSTSFTVNSVPENQFFFTILTDGFGSEDNAWTLYQLFANKQTLIASKDIGAYDNNMPYTERLVLAAGTYQFNLTDAYGDGITRPGYFTLSLGGTIIKSGKPFTYLDTTIFTVKTSPKPISKPAAVPAPRTPMKPISKPVTPAAVKPVLPKPVPKLPNKPFPGKPLLAPAIRSPAHPLPPKPAATKAKKARLENS